MGNIVMSAKVRAAFTVETHGRVVAVVDQSAFKKSMSVTNDAENVVRYLHDEGLLRHERLVYRDTMGCWDEIRHDGAGRFQGFICIGARTLEDAIKKMGNIE